MILINRELPQAYIYLTLDGLPFEPILYLQNDATRAKFEVELGLDSSPYPGRYNLFTIPIEDFTDAPDGYYTYAVKESVGLAIIESGKLYIIPRAGEITPSAEAPAETLIIIN